ncbi:MAG: hypothetical protein WBA67_05535 [Jannaschia sp.]
MRVFLDAAAKRIGRSLSPMVGTASFELIRHYVQHERLVGRQLQFGLSEGDLSGVRHCPISERDMLPGRLFLDQMRGRALSVASSRFADQLRLALANMETSGQG